MFSPTCSIWARMSPLPTQLPSRSRGVWPATKICRVPPTSIDHDLGIQDLVAVFPHMQLVRLDALALGPHGNPPDYIRSTAGITSLVNSLSERMAVSAVMVPRNR